MVDINATDLVTALEELKELAGNGAGLGALENYIKKVIIQLNLGKDGAGKLNGALTELKKAAVEITSIDWTSELENWGKGLDLVKEKVYQTVPGIGILASKIALLTPQLIGRADIPKTFEVIGDAADNTSAKINESFMAMVKLIDPELTKTKTVQYLASLSAYADASKRFEMGLVMSAAATGQLADVIGTTGQNIDSLALRSEAFSDMTVTIGNASGYSAGQVAKYAKELMSIPGALVDADKPGLVAGERIHFLDAAMKVATGTGQTFEQVMEDMTFSFENMGVKGQPALEFSARMQNASQALGMPLKFVKQYTEDAASAFSLYAEDTKAAADMSQSAINIMGRIGPALQSSGLGPKAITDVVKGVTDGISRMDTAQKAFLSSQTGGAGGLQGAFQIDQMLAEGKIDEVFDKVKQNMTQKLGGPIVTRKEAASSPEAAAQFQKQIMFMMSPAMGGMAKDQASAVKLLEAMASGKGEMPQGLQDKDKALHDVMERGSKLQERGNNTLVRIANASERMATLQAITSYEKSRQIGGSENSGFQSNLMRMRGQAAEAAKIDPLLGRGLDGGRSVKEVISNVKPMDSLKENIDSAFEYIKSAGRSISDEARGYVNPVPGAPGISPATRNTLNTDQLVARTIENNDKSDKNKFVRNTSQDKVNVAVTTVCVMCQRKIAADEAEKVIAHNHDKSIRQNWMGTPNP
jgi:hypothetical protein